VEEDRLRGRMVAGERPPVAMKRRSLERAESVREKERRGREEEEMSCADLSFYESR
jgi:hypothetical protein